MAMLQARPRLKALTRQVCVDCGEEEVMVGVSRSSATEGPWVEQQRLPPLTLLTHPPTRPLALTHSLSFPPFVPPPSFKRTPKEERVVQRDSLL